MSNETVTQVQQQFDSVFAGPARTYANLVLGHFEQLANVQLEAARAYIDTSVAQARIALEMKDPSDVRAYLENQQKVAKELGERTKGAAEKVVSLNQNFVQEVQKVAGESANSVSKVAAKSK
ncbi:MAG: phasin family protein [Ectothiorhodospiraceae bacterium]|nr:phasin family protein [Ectothiorhodospiraceae bacterium]